MESNLVRRQFAEIAFFLHDLDGGGAERAIIALAGEIAKRGYAVDLVVGDADSDYRSEISPAVNLINFATRSPLRIFHQLIAYLRERKPAVTVSALDLANIMLVIARTLAGYKGRTVICQRAVVDASLRELPPLRKVITKLLQRICFPRADLVISNSLAAAHDLRTSLNVTAGKVVTIHNALDPERIDRLAREPVTDVFLLKDSTPLIVSVGSLTKRKDMDTLVRAFKIVCERRPARLVIIGKGPERQHIEALVLSLDLNGSVYLPGFDANPYRWIAAAAVFASSSTGEGFPNVIAEALALGRPIVATDCPGDTAELLEHGRWGRLVPVGDAVRLADALLAALDDPTPPDGRVRAADFAPEKITSAYVDVLLSKPD